MNTLPASRYDGHSSASQPVTLAIYADGTIKVNGEGLSLSYSLDDIDIPAQVGAVPARLQFPDNSLCEVADYRALRAALPAAHKGGFLDWVHHWENSLKYALLGMLLAVAIIWGGVEYLLPAAAKHVAERIPLEWETITGEQTLAALERLGLLTPTQLTEGRRQQLLQQFNAALHKAGRDPLPRIEFRHSKAIGANALALPSGILVFTDGMVKIAEDDRELLGILGHELGHVEHRHAMRHVLQNSALALLLIMITGDVGSASSLAATLPTLLAQAKYSRQFETEADTFAVSFMQQQGLDTRYLTSILQRLGEEYGDGDTTGYLDSHPATAERVLRLTGS